MKKYRIFLNKIYNLIKRAKINRFYIFDYVFFDVIEKIKNFLYMMVTRE